MRYLLAAAWFVVCFGAIAQADPIVEFTFPDLSTGKPDVDPGAYEASTVAPGVMVTGIIPGSGLTATSIIEVSNPGAPAGYPTQPVLRISTPQTTFPNAVNNNSYFEFTVTPDDKVLNLSSLTFQAGKGGSGLRGVGVFSSVTGLALGDELLFDADVDTTRPTFTDYIIDLSGAEFQNLVDPITFRFNFFTTGTGASLEFDNILLSGTLAEPVPEPASLALWFSLGGVACIVACGASRRRRG